MKKRVCVILMMATMAVSSVSAFANGANNVPKTFSNVTMKLSVSGTKSRATATATIDDSRGRYVDGTVDIRDTKTRKSLFATDRNWYSNTGRLSASGSFAAPNTLDCYLYAYVDNGNWDDSEIINFMATMQ